MLTELIALVLAVSTIATSGSRWFRPRFSMLEQIKPHVQAETVCCRWLDDSERGKTVQFLRMHAAMGSCLGIVIIMAETARRHSMETARGAISMLQRDCLQATKGSLTAWTGYPRRSESFFFFSEFSKEGLLSMVKDLGSLCRWPAQLNRRISTQVRQMQNLFKSSKWNAMR